MFTHEIRNGIAFVTFDSGGMNTLSAAAVEALDAKVRELGAIHARTPLAGVILTGNKFGLGAGANIGELMHADRGQLSGFIDRGHQVLYAIEDGPLPWLAVIDGFALGGIYELALACRGIIATPKSTLGFPEIRLNIFPGLGGTQRMPRRSGLINASDPINGDAGFTAVLTGKNFRAAEAAAIRMIDAVIPGDADVDQFAERFLRETLPSLDRTPPADLANAESLIPMVLPMVQKATMGRPNPRAPYVALEVMAKGAALPLKEANALERDAFIDICTSPEGRAGMRFFFTQQSVQKLPKSFPGAARTLKTIGVDGADGYMGNAIAWLALEAGYQVVAHVPLAQFAASVPEKLAAKYGRAVKKGAMSAADVDKKVGSVTVATDIAALRDCDLVIEARMENRQIKGEFYRALGGVIRADALVASNSSSMGPGLLGADFRAGGGDLRQLLNLHFFSPAEHPMMQLVEVIAAPETSADAVATAHAFVRRINKTPVLLRDGSPGFLVNAGLAAYMLAAETLYREGTPAAAIDRAMRESIFPVGPFELGDQAGLDIAAGMFDTIAAAETLPFAPLAWTLREQKRFGIKNGAGIYEYSDGKPAGEWPGLAALVPDRGSRVASAEEIVERCARALYAKARQLCDRGIVASEAECDLAFVFGIGFAMYLGGPIFYGQQRGWDRA
ncbi:enoyl-CoA hydratase/isomerase family protein [bacterium]|nr:enoyl-CoA hydratase/isomerase family protein [bacterium]